MGKKSSETKITGPWKPLQEPMKDVIGRAGNLSNQPFYADSHESIGNAYNQMIERAQDPNSGLAAAQSAFHRTAAGDYLDPDSNPWLRKTYEAAAGDVMGSINSEFSKAGRYSSGAHQETLQDGLGRLATSIYAPAYQYERGQQMNAARMMPYMDTADLNQMLTGGQGLTGIDQRILDDPRSALQFYLSALQGVGGTPMGSKTTQKSGIGAMFGDALVAGASAAGSAAF